jgi:uncharacterized protein (DUF362 family)
MMKNMFAVLCVLALSAVVMGGCADPAPKPVVVIVKGEDPKEMMARAFELMGGLESIVGDAKTIVMKPNLTGLMGGQYQGVSTSGEVMEALVIELKKSNATAKYTLAEGPGGANINWILRATNMEKVTKDYDIEVIDTNRPESPRVRVELPDGQAYKHYNYPQVALEADVFIDVPVMKTHQLSGITVGFKNLFGYFDGGTFRRGVYHDRYSDALIDMVSIRKPDLIVVDALKGMEGRGPLWGSIVEHNLIIVGTDIVAVDTVCGALMGQPIEQIPYTNKAAKLGMGVADLKNIEIRGESVESVKKNYVQPRWYVGTQVTRTQEVIDRVAKLADSMREDIDSRDNTVSCRIYSFGPDHLKPDLKKNPTRMNTGFDVYVYTKWEDKVNFIEFQTRYNLYWDNLRDAAEAETRAWIKENLGDLLQSDDDVKTLPLGGDWNGRKE